jgi:REP element-mobilizing transposase RayT
VVAPFRRRCHAYCLIPNHYHLLLETPDENLARGMLVLNGWYARRFNLRNDRVGHVFGGPFASKCILTDEHLLEVSRSIVLNPVRAALATGPRRRR